MPSSPYERLLKHFNWAHLPEHLKPISEPFFLLALAMIENDGEIGETMAGLRKLLEAKDCAVRAMVK